MESFVEFPKLGLKFGISDILFQFDLFGQTITIRWYGLIIALGFLLAMIYGLKRAKQFDIDPDRMIDVVLVSALFAFVGAGCISYCSPISGRNFSPIPCRSWRCGRADWGFTGASSSPSSPPYGCAGCAR